MSEQDIKEATKEAIRETIDEYVTKFGWLSLKVLGTILVSGLLYFSFMYHGWKLPVP